jgi:hypothetical protein
MPRGGKRQGTPGKGYTNRTDLGMNYDQGQMTAAAGGMQAPPGPTGPAPLTPEDSPMLSDPTQRPDEPITAGLPIGAGPGPRGDNRAMETQALKKYLPLLAPYLDQPETPDSVRMLFRYIKGA